jgi:hypothetical protein
VASRLFAGVVVTLGVSVAMPSARVEHTARELVGRYDRGDVDQVVTLLSQRADDVGDFADDLRKMSADWISGQPPDVAVRRRLVVATVALEAARAMPPHPDRLKITEKQWAARVRLVEWGCDLLRSAGPPAGAAERWWGLASVAFLEQGAGHPFYAYDGLWSSGVRHLVHLAPRVPDEPRWALADGVFAEQAAGLVGYPLDDLPNDPALPPRYDVHVRETPAGADLVFNNPKALTFPIDRKNFRVPLRAAVQNYSRLRSNPAVGAEADLRLGAIETTLDQPSLAYPHFTSAAARLRDPLLLYAAHFFCAAALTRLGQVQEAQLEFRRALDVMPHAESATVGLAWLLSLNQHRHEASLAAADALAASTASKTPTDPLTMYPLGDAHLWSTYIVELRRAIGLPPIVGGRP